MYIYTYIHTYVVHIVDIYLSIYLSISLHPYIHTFIHSAIHTCWFLDIQPNGSASGAFEMLSWLMTFIFLVVHFLESSLLCQIYGITPQMFVVGEAPNLVGHLPNLVCLFVAEMVEENFSRKPLYYVKTMLSSLKPRRVFPGPSIPWFTSDQGLAFDGSGHRLVQLGRGHCSAGRAAGPCLVFFRTQKMALSLWVYPYLGFQKRGSHEIFQHFIAIILPL